jgi:hypothetical protein
MNEFIEYKFNLSEEMVISSNMQSNTDCRIEPLGNDYEAETTVIKADQLPYYYQLNNLIQ